MIADSYFANRPGICVGNSIVWFRVQCGKKHARESFSKTVFHFLHCILKYCNCTALSQSELRYFSCILLYSKYIVKNKQENKAKPSQKVTEEGSSFP